MTPTEVLSETGSNFVENLTNLKSGNLILLARITQVEVHRRLLED
jgi:hypothetical protein